MRIIQKTHGLVSDYDAPILFSDFRHFSSPQDRRKYIEHELIRLAKENKLYITDILNQEVSKWQYAGQIILGQRVDQDSQLLQSDFKIIPLELQNYKVKIRSVCNETIRWKRGMEPDRGRERTIRSQRVIRYSDVIVETDVKEIELFLWDAWLCLRQAGKYCRKATNERLRDRFWKYEEVKPPGLIESDEPEPPKRGGRKKAA